MNGNHCGNMYPALMFPGQGAQYVGMGRSLNECSDAAADIFSRAEKILGHAFIGTCFYGPDIILMQTSICQPALFAHGCAAVAALRAAGIEQYSVAYGLSLGELTALWAAGVFDFEVGMRVVAERGRLMQKACDETSGAMLCLTGGISDEVAEVCHCASVEIANVNCPGQIVVSGEAHCIAKAREVAEKMSFKRVLCLNVAGAYHSRLMEKASGGFEKFLKNFEFHRPRFKILTNVTGEAVESPEEIKSMLVRQIISPVLFEKCCRNALQMGTAEYFECGPGRTLSGMMKKINGDVTVKNFDKIEDFPAPLLRDPFG
ncbi:MAG: ACP S-malonyltransferase [Puniceicoccales bacterium]|jgi:[acyl-carrier-protein] S-malonyltransferase|nr:ACP S-malonyltransferase [Puniceicoccales bacterium]